MTDAITVRFDDAELLARLQQIAQRFGNMAPAMRAIGEVLSESTKQRFYTSSGPDGERWEQNALATVLGRLAQISGAYSKKTGRLTKKGADAFTSKKPLVATGELRDGIRYQVAGDGNSVEIGTNRFAGEWSGGAAVHQSGDKKGRIPARPFLGMSAEDKVEVLAILDRFVEQAVGK